MRKLFVVKDWYGNIFAECETIEDTKRMAEEMVLNTEWERYKYIDLYLLYSDNITYEVDRCDLVFYEDWKEYEDQNEDWLVVYVWELRFSEIATMHDILDCFKK